jgi:hypothetical protein
MSENKANQILSEGPINIIHGDCLTAMHNLPPNSVRAIVTLATQTPVGFWRTVLVLLGAARRRANGRRRRQRELLTQRTGRQASTDWSFFGVAVTVLFMAILNAGAGFVLLMAIDAAQRVSVESRGKIVVDGRFDQAVENIEAVRTRQLRDDVQAHGAADLVPARPATPGIKAMARTGPVPMMFGLCRQHSGR